MYTSLLCLICFGFVVVVRTEDCPGCDWKAHGGKCYLFNSEKLTQSAAEKYCCKKGGYLAEPRSASENSYIAKSIKVLAFIGYNDKKTERHFVGGHSGQPVTFTNWNRREPNDLHGEDCTHINFGGITKWNDIPCSWKYASVCEYYPCPNGWDRFNDNCYKVFHPANWWQAKKNCENHGGFLAEPKNAHENNHITQLSGGKTWIGLNDIAKEGRFVWASDKSSPVRGFWYPREPNNQGGEDCAETNFRRRTKWNDIPCRLRRTHVCQMRR